MLVTTAVWDFEGLDTCIDSHRLNVQLLHYACCCQNCLKQLPHAFHGKWNNMHD